MNTSPSKTQTVEKTVSVEKEPEIEIRRALHEFYAMQLPLNERKTERMREYMAQLRSPEVDFETLMRNTLLDEDTLRWMEKDYELITMAYPEWVKKFERRLEEMNIH